MPIYNDGFHCHGDLHSPIGIGPRGPKGEKGDTFKFADMTEDQINRLRTDISSVYYQKKEMTITTSVADTSTITIPFNDYDETDMLLVNIDGLMLSDGTDYSINGWNIVLNEPIANPGTHVNLIMLSAIALNVQDLGSLIPFEGVTTEKIAYKAVTKDKLGDGSVTDMKLATNSVTSLKIANQAVTGTKLSDGSVSASKLAKDSVTNESLADNAVDASNICSGAVITSKLASGAVITSKLGNNSVTSEKLAVDAVKGFNIYDGAVTQNKLAEAIRMTALTNAEIDAITEGGN